MTWRGRFFRFDFSDCFPGSFRFSFWCKWRTETLPWRFLLSFYYNMSGFRFQLFKSKYTFCRRVSEKFPLSFLTFSNSLFTNIVKPRYFREFVLRNVGFWNSLVRNFNQSISKLSHWILRQGQLVRQPRHTQSVEGHPVSPVESPVFSNRFIISKRSF